MNLSAIDCLSSGRYSGCMSRSGKAAPKRTPKAPESPSLQVCVRLSRELVQRLDAHRDRMQAKNPGLAIARADAVRVLLTLALDEVEVKQ